jgi:hypothetical protein
MNFADGLRAAGAIVRNVGEVASEPQSDAERFAEYIKMQCTPNGTAFQVIEDDATYRRWSKMAVKERYDALLKERLRQARETMEANLVKNLYSRR